MAQWHTQAGNLTTYPKVKIDFILPEFSAKNIVVWKFHVGDSTKGVHDMILGRYLLTALVLSLKNSRHAIKLVDKPLK